MVYVLIGKILSLLAMFVLKKLVTARYTDLEIYEVMLGWFLLEYVNEEYSVTAGNLFFTIFDFRNLIFKFGLVFKEIICKFYLILLFKYVILLISFLLLCLGLKFKSYSNYLNLLLKIYIYNSICYFFGLNLYFINFILFCSFAIQFNNKFWVIKLSFCIFLLISFLFILPTVPVGENLIINNFLQENIIKYLTIYMYFYYFELK